ncbi:MAG: right-handed parallel beta-helix repeat-containing protein [Verrucomicrobiota bacterium]
MNASKVLSGLTNAVVFLLIFVFGTPDSEAKVHRSSELGWKEDQDITEALQQLLAADELKQGEELRLEHTFRIADSHQLPDNFTLSAVKGAGLNVTDAVNPKNGRALLELGNGVTVRNLTITYLDTPPLGPTGEKHEVNFTRRLGIQARDKSGIRIENCRLTGSIGHHLKLTDCSDIEVIGTHVAGGHWSVLLIGCDKLVFRRCLIEKCQGDGIKTGGGASGAVRRVLVENCVFQDNLRDGIDTTGGFNDSIVRNCIFRRLGVSGLDLKSHYESRTGRIEDLAPENIGILVEKCLFHDMPNALVITTLDSGRRSGPGNELLNAANMKEYAAHDIDVNDCIIGHAEKPLRTAKEGGYGVNYPSEEGEHMRMILMKDAYDVRYKNARFFGERIRPVQVSSIGGSNHLSKEAAAAIEPTISGKIGEPAPQVEPGQTEVPFTFGPQPLD